jgi:hypothetical protein
VRRRLRASRPPIHTRRRHLTRKPLIAPRRISLEPLRKSHIYQEVAVKVRQAVASGMFPEAGGTLPAVGMAAGEETTQEAGTAASTMADGNRPGNG